MGDGVDWSWRSGWHRASGGIDVGVIVVANVTFQGFGSALTSRTRPDPLARP